MVGPLMLLIAVGGEEKPRDAFLGFE